jgi:hypothetical protein
MEFRRTSAGLGSLLTDCRGVLDNVMMVAAGLSRRAKNGSVINGDVNCCDKRRCGDKEGDSGLAPNCIPALALLPWL